MKNINTQLPLRRGLALAVICLMLWAILPGVSPTSASTCAGPSFAPTQSYNALLNSPQVIATADFTLDGNLDLVVGAYFSSTISVLPGNGNGGFGTPIHSTVAHGNVFSIAIGDFNNDGKFDLATVSNTAHAVSILLGNGQGGFTFSSFIDVGSAFHVAHGDLNMDGNADLVVARHTLGDVLALLGNGQGGFSAPIISSAGQNCSPKSIVVSEFDANGIPDLGVACGGPYVVAVMGNGAGGFVLPREVDNTIIDYNIGGQSTAIAVGYLNNDTEIDLVVASRQQTEGVRVLIGDYGPYFHYNQSYGAHDTPTSIASADFNGDGRDDVAVTNWLSDDLSVMLGGAGNFNLFTHKVDFPLAPRPESMTIGDFNWDGRPDVATANSSGGLSQVTVLLNSCSAVTISGRLRDADGQVLSGTTVTLSGTQSATATTDAAGYYSFANLTAGGNYSVTPTLAGRTFKPSSRHFTNLTGFKIGNFITSVTKNSNFDGDNRADVAVWQPDSGNWNIINSSDGSNRTQPNWGLGALGDIPVPGDYDGDNKTDTVIFRASEGNWYIIRSSDGAGLIQNWGGGADKPVAADYDGDRKTDIAVFRPNEGNWYILKSSTGTSRVQGWGVSTDKPVPADYDGDGKTDVAIFRPNEGNWYIINSSNNSLTIRGWGANGDKPVPGDYDGDGKDDVAVFRPFEGNWYIRNSADGTGRIQNWGNPADKPVPADYDGDGRTDVAVWRGSEGNWYIINSGTGSGSLTYLGQGAAVPLPSAYLPN